MEKTQNFRMRGLTPSSVDSRPPVPWTDPVLPSELGEWIGAVDVTGNGRGSRRLPLTLVTRDQRYLLWRIPPRPTYRTIAREAGVSPVTVSLALRNSPKITKQTRARVYKVAQAQGYRKDPDVQKLMHHLRMRRQKNLSSNLVALRLVNDENSIYAARVLAGTRERAEVLGYALDVIDLDKPFVSPARLEKVLRSRGVEGVIILPIYPIDLSGHLNWAEFSVVATSHSVLRPRFNTVVPNQFTNMLKLCRQLADAGEKRIGMFTRSNHDLRVNHRFLSAYLWDCHVGGAPAIPPLILDADTFDKQVLIEWIETHAPDVIVTELVARGTIRQELPKTVLRKVKWAHTDLDSETPGDWGIYEDPEEVGRAAIELLAAMILRGERGIPASPRCMEIEGKIICPH